MTDIRIAIEQLPEPEKSLNKALIEFYQTMKGLENDPERGGKQATKIIMTCSDIQNLFSEHSTKEQWISVKDELPGKDGNSDIWVLTFDKKQGICVRPYNEYHQCWDDKSGDDYYCDAVDGHVTHWQPLPAAPVKK